MKKYCILFLSGLMHLACNAQEAIAISSDLELVRVSDNAYVHVSYSTLPGYGRVAANGLIFIDGKEAFLFDTPWNDSLTRDLVTYMEDKMGLEICGFVPNHWHDDCMGGLGYLESRKIKTYANQMTIDITMEKGLPAPETGFRDSLELHPGNKAIWCYFPGAAHSMDNIVVWIPSEKILFPGCICKSLDSRTLGNTADGDTSAYPAAVDWIIGKFKEAKVVIPGHGAFGGTELLYHTRSLCDRH